VEGWKATAEHSLDSIPLLDKWQHKHRVALRLPLRIPPASSSLRPLCLVLDSLCLFQELLRRNWKEMKHSLRLPNKTSLVLGGCWLPGNSARHFHRTTTILCAPQAVRILTNSQSIFTHFRFSNKMFNSNHNRKVMSPTRFSV